MRRIHSIVLRSFAARKLLFPALTSRFAGRSPAWIYVGDHHLDRAEWFCKVDYDTFFFPENLQYYVRDLRGWDPMDHHYFGLELAHKVRAGPPWPPAPRRAGARGPWRG